MKLDPDLEVVRELSKGNWSVVMQGSVKSTALPVAIKIGKGENSLLREATILNHLQGIQGIPLLVKHGSHDDTYFIAMQKLDCTLSYLYKHRQLTPISIISRFCKLLELFKQVHSRGILHQDITPNNLMAVYGSETTYLIDYGLSNCISRHSSKGPLLVGIFGTPSFLSKPALMGLEQDRKDELESLGYNLVWLIKGKLPWEKYTNSADLGYLKRAKFNTPISVICKGCPEELVQYFSYVRSLSFRDLPNYSFLIGLLKCAAHKLQSPMLQGTETFDPFNFGRKMRVLSIDSKTSQTENISTEFGRLCITPKALNSSNFIEDSIYLKTPSVRLSASVGLSRASINPLIDDERMRKNDCSLNLHCISNKARPNKNRKKRGNLITKVPKSPSNSIVNPDKSVFFQSQIWENPHFNQSTLHEDEISSSKECDELRANKHRMQYVISDDSIARNITQKLSIAINLSNCSPRNDSSVFTSICRSHEPELSREDTVESPSPCMSQCTRNRITIYKTHVNSLIH